MTVSVIIRAYADERWDGLVGAVASLDAQTRRPDQVVLVVDHNPALLARGREAFPDATVVVSAVRGASGGGNAGLSNATGEIVAFMDDDAVAEPTWLERLLAPYRDAHIAGVGGKIVPRWVTGAPEWFPEEFHWVVGCSYRGLPEQRAPVRNLIGCNMSFRREALERIGGFREKEGLGHAGARPVGGEETELCIRLRQREPSAVLLHEPAAVVHHTVPEGRARFAYFLRRCAAEGRSKAAISRLSGARDGLSSEGAYVARVLPSGVGRGITDGLRGDLGGIRRSGAIVAGLATTAGTYLAARADGAIAARRAGRTAETGPS